VIEQDKQTTPYNPLTRSWNPEQEFRQKW
jgi:hypothetical protein